MPIQGDDRPLIVTALLGRDTFTLLDGLRRRHFPPVLNKVPAHISLFHHLPGAAIESVVTTVAAQCQGRSSMDLPAIGLRSLGRGVAIMYEPGDLLPLHTALARTWADWLTPQDRQPFKPHVTIQNKVAPDEARSLLEAMNEDHLPVCRVEGATIWRYLGGPWDLVASCPFGTQ